MKNNSENLEEFEKDYKEFEKLYQELDKMYITQLNSRKTNFNKNIKKASIFIIIFILIWVIFENKIPKYWGNIVNTLGIISSFVLIKIVFSNRLKITDTEYIRMFKEKITKNLITKYNENLIYYSDNPYKENTMNYYADANFEEYNGSLFLIENNLQLENIELSEYMALTTDDYIEGQLNNNLMFRMADINVIKIINNEEYRKKIPIFNGIFSFIEFNKNINTSIKLKLEDGIERISNSSIFMDSYDFESFFDIEAEDKILALRIFTSEIMLLLVEFYKKYNIKFEIQINYDRIYLRFFTGDTFDSTIYDTTLQKEILFKYYIIMKVITKLSEKLNDVLEDLEI